jgi:hypothetical protein
VLTFPTVFATRSPGTTGSAASVVPGPDRRDVGDAARRHDSRQLSERASGEVRVR